MPGNLITKQFKSSFNNAVRELNKSNSKYNSYILHKIRVIVARELNLLTLEMQVGGKLRYINNWISKREDSK